MDKQVLIFRDQKYIMIGKNIISFDLGVGSFPVGNLSPLKTGLPKRRGCLLLDLDFRSSTFTSVKLSGSDMSKMPRGTWTKRRVPEAKHEG